MNKQPEQEPVACHHCHDGKDVPDGETCNKCGFTHLPYGYTTPPQRTWKHLTGEDILKCIPSAIFNGDLHATTFALEIEAVLKEKNT